MPSRRLPKAAQKLIVTELACFTSPSDVRDMLEKEFGITMNLSSIVYYDPTTAAASQTLGQEWQDLFRATRKAFIDDTSRVAISHRSFRLRRLDRLTKLLEQKLNGDLAGRNVVLFSDLTKRIAELDRQAAEEIGDAYTNKRMLLSGDPEEELAKELGISVDELRAALVDAKAKP
jgi:hypothetical protein